ncbi:MAG: 50S ribosomal protein L10 [Lentisphaerae bacterium]|nr:50S ribosomal protein L10 [Lentisphaerota bacterium]MBE6400348.1 50S ribosomal protein L10 [Lentisphaerota bacterium]
MRIEKQYLANSIADAIKNSDYVYFISFAGLTVKSFSDLRDQLAAAGAKCQVQKNTLIKKAADQLQLEGLEAIDLTASTAMVFGQGDCSAVAKLLVEFGKKQEQVKAKGGYMDGAVLSSAEVGALADLPAKPVLQAMLLGVLQAPARNLVTVLNAKVSSIVNVVNAYKDKLENTNN